MSKLHLRSDRDSRRTFLLVVSLVEPENAARKRQKT
jgi:hypothetical protein